MTRIVDFAAEVGQDPATIGAYMKHHKMQYDRKTGLTDEQIAELSKQYKKPSDVVAVDNESREQLLVAQAEIIRLKDEIISLTKQASKIELLEDLQAKQEQRQEELAAELTEARQEIERLKNRSLWQRLMNK